MKIIFLDIDGVLNYQRSTSRIHGCLGIDDDKLLRLAHIYNYSKALIILTSTWKLDWFKGVPSEDLNCYGQYMVKKFRQHGLNIFDKTDDDGMNRGEGILNWIRTHVYPIESIVILDDEMFDYEELGLSPYVVKSSFYNEPGGLQAEHVQQALEILRKDFTL